MKIVKAAYEFVSDVIPMLIGMAVTVLGLAGLMADDWAVNIIAIVCVIGGLWVMREQIRKEEERKAIEWLGTVTGKVASNVAIVLISDEEGCTRRVKIWKDSEPPDDLAKDEAA